MEKIVKPSLFHDRNVEQKPKSTFKRQNGFVVVLSMIILLITVFFVPIRVERSFEYHVKKMAPLIEKRYFSEGTEYTDYTVYPLYNEHDKLAYFVIEFEPYGYMYISLNKCILFFSCYLPSAYTRSSDIVGELWHRYTLEKGVNTEVTDKNGHTTVHKNERWETDANGNIIEYRDSHFKVAGIQDEKRYLLRVEWLFEKTRTRGYVPAVKRHGKYLNLVSMQEMDYVPEVPMATALSNIGFFPKNFYDL